MSDCLSIEQTLQEYGGYIRKVAARYLDDPHDVDDATQDALVKVALNIGQFRQGSRLSTWLFAIARNSAVDLLRRKPDARYQDMDRIVPEQSGTADSEDIRLGFMEALLTVLSATEQRVYILGELCKVDSAKGGAALGLSPANFRQVKGRARKKLLAFREAHCQEAGALQDMCCDFETRKPLNVALLASVTDAIRMEAAIREMPVDQLRSYLPL